MAHQLYTPVQAARSSLAALRFISTLPRTVNTQMGSEFINGRGQTVNILKPVELTVPEARVYSKANRDARDAIVFDEVAQTYKSITITDQVYKAVRLPDDFETFTLTSLEQQVLAPMMESVATGVAKPLIEVMKKTASAAAPITMKADGSDALAAIIKLRQELNKRSVPLAGRTIAVGSAIEAALLNLPQLQKVNESGTDGLLREATIGRLFGFDIIVAPELGDDFAVAYQRDAFALVTRPSVQPKGAAFSANVSQDGFGLRYIQHYNPLQLEDQAIIDTFVGADFLDERRAVSMKLA